MNQRRIRRLVLLLTMTALVGAVAAPAAQAGSAPKPGNGNPCQIEQQPKPKPAQPPADKAAAEKAKQDRAKAEKARPADARKGEDKGKDSHGTAGMLVCGDIAKVSGTHRVTIRTEKGLVVVQITRDTEVYKGDAKVSPKALTVGATVAIKAEQFKNGTIKALGILVL